MKNWFFLFAIIALPAVAFDPFEDTAENLAPQSELNYSVPNLLPRSQGTWVYAFELMNADGTSRVLTESNRSLLVKPASTMKLFTSWFAYKNSYRDNTYLGKMLKESVNAMADSTLIEMGGAEALKAFYDEKGLSLNSTNFIQADGSGLSYENKANCDSEIELLKLMYRDETFADFKALLARPGEEGTLKARLLTLAGSLYAKTGTLDRTASLSGFVETKVGAVVFCVLTDYLPSSSSKFRPKIDKLVIDTVQSLEL